jgi:Raf kinase inhibitor-like YbhB/YbcL family protein
MMRCKTVLMTIVGVLVAVPAGTACAEPFTLASPVIADGAMLPAKYAGAAPGRSCGGDNVSPPLQWSNAPAATKSFALLMFDPEGGRGIGSSHWIAYGIPATLTALREGDASQAPTAYTGGKNSVGTNFYFGPCGPAGGTPHHYVISVIAMDFEPGKLPPDLTRDAFLQELRGHGLAISSIVAKYGR